eukprot:TRINITY_DN636_c0_g1_i1.p2 TRINITY_DN636_c0_g1~~TRINITY_DN636_c0_g1_i1.p2  ORF type:complete len:1463 (-),score=213.99 TRINITY_DN636_c0_g1_i1:13076-17464(-)
MGGMIVSFDTLIVADIEIKQFKMNLKRGEVELTPVEESFDASSHSTVHSIRVTPFMDTNPAERVHVHVRLRPFLKEEEKVSAIEFCSSETSQITGISLINTELVSKDFDKKSYTFDSVIPPLSSQKSVFDSVAKPVVDRVLEGYNGTIFAYGQTGTGKTFTMVGDKHLPEGHGIIPRSLEYIFSKVQCATQGMYEISMSFIQIYMEAMQDLLEPGNTSIKIREDPACGVFVTGVSWIPAGSVDQCMNIFDIGEKNRAVAFTALNAHSSRSHAVLMIKVERKPGVDGTFAPEKVGDGLSATTSILYLVDLAGSERVKKTKATANRLDEAKKINFSLSALGNCIHALTDPKAKHIPYRDSKLTRLLQDSLGGNAKTSMVVTIGPYMKHVDETLSSLKFGKRAMHVQNKPRINQKIDYKGLCIELQGKLYEKNELLNEAETKIKKLSEVLKHREEVPTRILKERPINNNENKGVAEKGGKQELEELKKSHIEAIRKKEQEHKEFLVEVDKMMADQEATLQQYKAELVQKNTEIEKNAKEIQKLRQQLKDALDSHKHKEENVAKSQKEQNEIVLKYKIQLNDAMETIQFKEEEVSKLEAEIECLKKQNIALGEDIASIGKEKSVQEEELKSSLEECENKYKERLREEEELHQQTLVEKDKEISELLTIKEECEKQIKELKNKVEKLESEKEISEQMSKNEVGHFEKTIIQKEEAIQSLENKLQVLSTQSEEKVRHITEEKDNKIAYVEMQLNDFKDQCGNIKAYNDVLNEEVEELRKQLETTTKQLSKTSSENSILRDQYSKLLSEHDELKISHIELKEKLATLKAQAEVQTQNAKARISELQEEIKQRDKLILENTEQHKQDLEKTKNDLKTKFSGKLKAIASSVKYEKEVYEGIVEEILVKHEELLAEVQSLQEGLNEVWETKEKCEIAFKKQLLEAQSKLRTVIELHKNNSIALEKQHKLIKQLKEKEDQYLESISEYCMEAIIANVCNQELEQKIKAKDMQISLLEKSTAVKMVEKVRTLELNSWTNFVKSQLAQNGKHEASLLFSELFSKSCTSKLFQDLPVEPCINSVEEVVKETVDDMIFIVEVESSLKREVERTRMPFMRANVLAEIEANPFRRATTLTTQSCSVGAVDVGGVFKRMSCASKLNPELRKTQSIIEEIGELISISDRFLTMKVATSEEFTLVKQLIRPLYNWIIGVSVGAVRAFYKRMNAEKIIEQRNKLIGTLISMIAHKERTISRLKERMKYTKIKINSVQYEHKAHRSAMKIQKAWRQWLLLQKEHKATSAMQVIFGSLKLQKLKEEEESNKQKLMQLLGESYSETGLFIVQQTTAHVENVMSFFKHEFLDAPRFAYHKFNYQLKARIICYSIELQSETRVQSITSPLYPLSLPTYIVGAQNVFYSFQCKRLNHQLCKQQQPYICCSCLIDSTLPLLPSHYLLPFLLQAPVLLCPFSCIPSIACWF